MAEEEPRAMTRSAGPRPRALANLAEIAGERSCRDWGNSSTPACLSGQKSPNEKKNPNHNLYCTLACSTNKLSKEMTTLLIRKMERRGVFWKIYSALFIQPAHGLLNIYLILSKRSLTGGACELKCHPKGKSVGELAEDSCPYWLDAGNKINAQKY